MKKNKSFWAILLILAVTIIGIIVNGGKSFSGYGEPSGISLLVSILFVLVWSIASLIYGSNNNRKYLILSTIYFLSMLLIAGVSFLLSSSHDTLVLFLIPALTVVIPLYGFVEVLEPLLLSEQIAAIICISSMVVINWLIFRIGVYQNSRRKTLK